MALIEQRRKNRAVVAAARKDLDSGELDRAEQPLKEVLAQDPSMVEARELLTRIYEKRAATVSGTRPALKSTFSKPITLEFRDATLKSVFEVISFTLRSACSGPWIQVIR